MDGACQYRILTSPSAPRWAWAALAWLIFHLFVVLYEEPKLTALFGEQFTAYRQRVRRWL